MCVLKGGALAGKPIKLGFSAKCVAVSGNDALVALGAEDSAVYLVDASGAQKAKLERHKSEVAAVAFSPDGSKLASGCANKEIVVWDPQAATPLVTGLQGFHTARISCFAWGADGTLASGGVDATINVWDLEGKKAKHSFKHAHASGGINALCFVDGTTLASAGSDAIIKTWIVA